jgi:hypothetical protein
MSSENSFIMVNLALMKGLKLSFIEAGLIERIRYFAEFDSKGSGWCYVGKQRLADELGLSKQGIYKVIDRLMERKLLIKNDKGWIKVSLEGVNSVDSQLSLPVNSVYSGGQLSLPNNILKEDNSNISIIDNSSKLLLGQQSLPVNKVDSKQSLPKKPKKEKVVMTDEEYGRMMISKGFKCYGEFGNVFLSEKNVEDAIEKVGTFVLKRTTETLSAYKETKPDGAQHYTKDYAVMCSWVFGKVKLEMQKEGLNWREYWGREMRERENAKAKLKDPLFNSEQNGTT